MMNNNMKINIKRIFNEVRNKVLILKEFSNGESILVDILNEEKQLFSTLCIVYKFEDDVYISSDDIVIRVSKDNNYEEYKLDFIKVNKEYSYEGKIETVDIGDLVLDKHYSELSYSSNTINKNNPNFKTLVNKYQYTVDALQYSEVNKISKNQFLNLTKSKNDEEFNDRINLIVNPMKTNNRK